MARKRKRRRADASRTHSTRFSRTPPGESRSLRNVLGRLAALRPLFFLRLTASTRTMEKA
jgi:hypothetical protein